VLELEADLEVVAELLRARELIAKDRPRAVRPRLSFDGDVAREARQVRLPRDEREAVEVRDRGDVRVARHLADLAGGQPRDAGALVREVVEMGGGDELRARASVHVDELREEELDSAILGDLADFLQPRTRGDGHGLVRLYHQAARSCEGGTLHISPPSMC